MGKLEFEILDRTFSWNGYHDSRNIDVNDSRSISELLTFMLEMHALT